MILPAGKWREHVSQKKNIAVSFTCVKEYDTLEPQLLKPVHLEPVLLNKRSHRNEKPAHRSEE